MAQVHPPCICTVTWGSDLFINNHKGGYRIQLVSGLGNSSKLNDVIYIDNSSIITNGTLIRNDNTTHQSSILTVTIKKEAFEDLARAGVGYVTCNDKRLNITLDSKCGYNNCLS